MFALVSLCSLACQPRCLCLPAFLSACLPACLLVCVFIELLGEFQSLKRNRLVMRQLFPAIFFSSSLLPTDSSLQIATLGHRQKDLSNSSSRPPNDPPALILALILLLFLLFSPPSFCSFL